MQQRAAGLQMSRLLNKFHRELHALHADRFPEGITGVNIRIINFLADNSKRDIFQRDIEEEFSVRRSTVSKVLSLMEEKNLIRRETVSGDARLKKLALTEHGYEVHRITTKDAAKMESRLLNGLSEEDQRKLFELLRKMDQNLD